jgi:hypothetical protein
MQRRETCAERAARRLPSLARRSPCAHAPACAHIGSNTCAVVRAPACCMPASGTIAGPFPPFLRSDPCPPARCLPVFDTELSVTKTLSLHTTAANRGHDGPISRGVKRASDLEGCHVSPGGRYVFLDTLIRPRRAAFKPRRGLHQPQWRETWNRPSTDATVPSAPGRRRYVDAH